MGLLRIFTGTTWTRLNTRGRRQCMAGPSDAASLDLLIQKSSAMTDAQVPTTTSAWVSSGRRRPLGAVGLKDSFSQVEHERRRSDDIQPRQRRVD